GIGQAAPIRSLAGSDCDQSAGGGKATCHHAKRRRLSRLWWAFPATAAGQFCPGTTLCHRWGGLLADECRSLWGDPAPGRYGVPGEPTWPIVQDQPRGGGEPG